MRVTYAKGLGLSRYTLVNGGEYYQMLLIQLGDWPEFEWENVWFIELGSEI
jgi:hypothetical protein